LLASDDWADVALAMLAKGDPAKALEVAVGRLREMGQEDRAWASGTLLLLSGILGIEDAVGARLKEVGMINVLENKVLGPMILEAEEKGRSEGRQEGVHELLVDLLTGKFGELPEWAEARLRAASQEELRAWAKRALRANTLEETLE
jgi:hypothetical protein